MDSAADVNKDFDPSPVLSAAAIAADDDEESWVGYESAQPRAWLAGPAFCDAVNTPASR